MAPSLSVLGNDVLMSFTNSEITSLNDSASTLGFVTCNHSSKERYNLIHQMKFSTELSCWKVHLSVVQKSDQFDTDTIGGRDYHIFLKQ